MIFAKRNSSKGDDSRLPWKQIRPRSPELLVLSILATLFALIALVARLYPFAIAAPACWLIWWSERRPTRKFVLELNEPPVDHNSSGDYAIVDIADPAQPLTPEGYYAKVWRLVADNFLYKEAAGEMWASFEHRFDGQLESIEDAGMAMQYALGFLDKYARLHDARDRKALEKQWRKKQIVRSKLLDGNVGYVSLRTFSDRRAIAEVRSALESLSSADAFVLDLRGNVGGLLSVALQILSMFLDGGLLCTEEVMLGQVARRAVRLTESGLEFIEGGQTRQQSRERNLTGQKPLVVLIDGGSWSASELVAAALKELGRARLVGEPTHGKGVGQIFCRLDFGTMLRLTALRLYTPSGRCVDAVGVFPDQVVPFVGKVDVQLDAAVHMALHTDALPQG